MLQSRKLVTPAMLGKTFEKNVACVNSEGTPRAYGARRSRRSRQTIKKLGMVADPCCS